MILILDGYNILKQVLTCTHIAQTERDAFIRLMGKYADKKNHKIIIFFDGGIYDKPYETRLKGVAVWYAGHHLTADDLIIHHAPFYKNKDAGLVTSDRALINSTSSYFKNVFEPHFFYAQVKDTFQTAMVPLSKVDIIKTSEEVNHELDALMLEAASLSPGYKEENESLKPHKQPSLSKKERKIEKSKKKL